MLICNNCGKTINEEDLQTHREFLAYVGDKPIYEQFYDNCFCGGEFVPAIQCDLCNEWEEKEKSVSGWRYNLKLCSSCFNRYKNKYDKIYEEFGAEDDFVDCLYEKNLIKI